MQILDQAEICQGATRPRTLLGIPTSVTMGLGAITALLLYVNDLRWVQGVMVVVACLLGGWLRWQTRLDPYWLQKWWYATRHPQQYR